MLYRRALAEAPRTESMMCQECFPTQNMDSQLNKNGGTLIFTTHHPELLDEYDRNDGICIVRSRNGITAENLSYILKRNDIKSDA